MLLLRAEKVKKMYGDRTVLDAGELSVYTNDRIGVVGANGAGKSTLFEILAGDMEPEEGLVERFGRVIYVRQLAAFDGAAGGEEAKLWKVPQRQSISGGEEMRSKLAEAFSQPGHVLLLDEPTANLDSEGTKLLLAQMEKAETFLCISHDRALLNAVCTKILEVDGGKLRLYDGNYEEYERRKEEERQKAQREYETYVQEKGRLEQVYRSKRESAARMVKIPRGMTPREAHLRDFLTAGGRNSSGRQKSMNRAADNVQKRIDHMEVKEKPKEQAVMRLDFTRTNPPENRKIIEVRELSFAYGAHRIFDGASFTVSNRKKTALLGPNGCGKSTLFSLLERAYQGEMKGIRLVPKAKLGILNQDFSQLKMEKTVLENAMEDSVQQPAAVKSVLAGLLFKPEEWEKRTGVLSGGERMKLALARLLVSGANVLLLDEPTNYLDLVSIRALEKQLKEYEGTVLFISHDREFVRRTAQELLFIEGCRVTKFAGTLDAWEEEQQQKKQRSCTSQQRMTQEERMRLELKVARLSGLLGHAPSLEEKERLEAEYWETVRALQRL